MSVVILLLLAVSVKMTTAKFDGPPTYTNTTVDEIVCRLKEALLVEARFGNERHFLCLKLRSIGNCKML